MLIDVCSFFLLLKRVPAAMHVCCALLFSHHLSSLFENIQSSIYMPVLRTPALSQSRARYLRCGTTIRKVLITATNAVRLLENQDLNVVARHLSAFLELQIKLMMSWSFVFGCLSRRDISINESGYCSIFLYFSAGVSVLKRSL